MSSIFVPEIAIAKSKNKFPAIFEKAVSRFNFKEESKSIEKGLRSSLRADIAAMSEISNREEEIWTVWANLCKASKG